jgi:hypothetical protein
MRSKTNVNLSSTPAHAILSPVDNDKILSFINFNNIGSSTLSSSTAFKKIQSASKTSPQLLFNLYLDELNTNDGLFYGIRRQHNYSSTASMLNSGQSNLDNRSVSKLISYNYGNTDLGTTGTNLGTKSLLNPLMKNDLDTNKEFNAIKSVDSENYSATNINLASNHLITNSKNTDTLTNLTSDSIFYKNFFAKSPNQQILSSDRNIRNIETLNPNKINSNFDISTSTEGLINKADTVFTEAHLPTANSASKLLTKSFDKFTDSNMNSALMAAKEELAPSFIFTPF